MSAVIVVISALLPPDSAAGFCGFAAAAAKKKPVPFSIRLSPKVYLGTLTLLRLGVLRKKF
ncbi:MAG TPA: hypothetical protein VIS03_06990 [Kiloniellaceae bacterium]